MRLGVTPRTARITRFPETCLVLGGQSLGTNGEIGTGTIPFALGASSGPSHFPKAAVGLAAAVLPDVRPFASTVLGRPRLCTDGGLMPEPTLAEKELLDVLRDDTEFTLEEADDARDMFRGGPENAVGSKAESTALIVGGAAGLDLSGSPALSTSVFLFGVGSGTANRKLGLQRGNRNSSRLDR